MLEDSKDITRLDTPTMSFPIRIHYDERMIGKQWMHAKIIVEVDAFFKMI